MSRPKLLAAALCVFFAAPASALKIERIPVAVGHGPAGAVPGAQGYEAVVAEEAVVWFARYVSTESRAVLVQSAGAGFEIQQGGMLDVQNSIAVLASTSYAFSVELGGIIRIGAFNVFGTGNTTFGFIILSGGFVSYTTKPTVTGTSGDVQLGGVAVAYASVPSIDLAELSMITLSV